MLCRMNTPEASTPNIDIPAVGDYRIDPSRSRLSFLTSHMFGLGKVRGSFRIEEGRIHVADPVGGSSARAAIAAASVDTGNSARDSMLRSPTYLDTAAHPHITFVSTRLERSSGAWVLHGTLTVRGTAGPVELRVERARAEGPVVSLTARCRTDRYAFGITKMKGMTGRWQEMTLDVTAERG